MLHHHDPLWLSTHRPRHLAPADSRSPLWRQPAPGDTPRAFAWRRRATDRHPPFYRLEIYSWLKPQCASQ
ncbi:conserved protein of unknown function [Cupriavidus taiwanensis]|uniref:Uncharacterized protein n=1 Tax=Cupriavidus taiwanensis TaxID=164546 RepID=A0A375FZN7_9BURK|nr:hypothetical protein CBM2585_A130713 [Cupriavidus taiwanensis]SOY88434.1 protein of unknown function [Cupriavidus taiwanensis]SPC11962.1 hypothetical protein CT19431_40661 [Cupriavidus taiwanensis]SPC16003.1 hypothetical protein CBM2594_A70568 [Cupriavidus taiwanensis]SPD40703.1 conserved protein of unknown function [Cupriavidus taiwanensis]